MLKNKSGRHVLAAFGGVLMLAGVGTTGVASAAVLRAVMSGSNLPGGDPDGWGRARIRTDDMLNNVCVDLEVRSISQVLSARIYRGAPGEKGEPVVNLDTPDDEDSDDCDTVGDALVDDIQRNPASFYVEVRTSEFPEGAIRGQVEPAGD